MAWFWADDYLLKDDGLPNEDDLPNEGALPKRKLAGLTERYINSSALIDGEIRAEP
ncbi:hypothetical protein [Dickeya ananatis]|uniref:hypothetical protein n=1 Tax=Dickeya ananatis TaxID=3061286 RepID=UPI00388DBFC2